MLASGFVRANPDAAPARIVDLWEAGGYALIVSPHILAEVEHTFQDRYFQRRMTADQIAADLLLLRTEATLVAITRQVHGVATHPEDDLVLATALSVQADYLATGDSHLQRLGAYEGVTILSPRAFLDLVESGPGWVEPRPNS